MSIKYISSDDINYKLLANLSVDKDPMSIEHISSNVENYNDFYNDLYEKAVKLDVNTIKYIPKTIPN